MNEILDNPSYRRAAAGITTALVVIVNRKVGLQLEMPDIVSLVTLTVAYFGQSCIKEMKMAQLEAATKVSNTQAAVDVFNGPPQAPANPRQSHPPPTNGVRAEKSHE